MLCRKTPLSQTQRRRTEGRMVPKLPAGLVMLGRCQFVPYARRRSGRLAYIRLFKLSW